MLPRIAILALDDACAAHVARPLEQAGFDCDVFHEETSLRRELRAETFELLIIDSSAPAASASELRAAARHRRAQLAVIRVLADPQRHAILDALEEGAHDCIVEPVRSAELAARASALLRRHGSARMGIGALETHGGFAFDPTLRAVRVDSAQVRLTTKEFQLARLLFRNLSRPVSARPDPQSRLGAKMATARRARSTRMCRACAQSWACARPRAFACRRYTASATCFSA